MGNGLLQTIKQVGIFVICAQMILHFKPAESYGKYMRLLVSIMVLVQLLVPLMSIFLKSDVGSFSDRISYYEEMLSDNMKDISATCADAEKMLNNMTMKEIKTRINNTNSTVQEQSNTESDNPIVLEDGQIQDMDLEEEKQEIQIERIEVLTDD